MEEIIKLLTEHKIPNKYPDKKKDVFENLRLYSYSYRDKIIGLQGFALLTNEWINEFAKWINGRKCLEIMSGCGALSKVLQDRDVDIIPTDNFSWDAYNSNWNVTKNYWTQIENIDAIEALEKYKDRDIVIMSWPYVDDTAYKCLLKMREVNPNMVMVAICEGIGGCTASEEFFDSAKYIEDIDIRNINRVFPSWIGIYDNIKLFK